jgi:hypothetical protein
MRREVFCVVLGMAVVLFSFACKKGEKAREGTIPQEPVQILEPVQAEGTKLLFTLDGKLGDWSGIEPLWKEAGMAGAGADKSSIDIQRVFFKSDSQYLYGFMQISPTIEDRFKISPTGDIIGDLFLDTDNNPGTGSAASETQESDKYKGYEVRVHIPVGVMSSEGKSSPYVAYEIYTHEGGFYGINVADRQDTMSKGSLIAHGPDGIEFALRLDTMKLAPAATVRILLQEYANTFEDTGYSVGQLTLQPAQE